MTFSLCKKELSDYMYRITGSEGAINLKVGEDNSIFDEHYIIDVKGGEGTIWANRPRALLLAVYDFLRRVGCRFLRPGINGEIVPKKTLEEITVQADVVPANRHRGITIEGAVSLENVLSIIEWAPKVGFNSYFIQFRTAFDFFERWYSHKNNPMLTPEDFSEEKSAEFVKQVVCKIKERDMIYHAVGHGWTASCIGLDVNGWKGVDDSSITDEQRSLLAEIGGKRGFFNNIPLNTHLCYSNKTVRERMVNEVCSYAEEHPEVDVLHFWLADDSNNVCECENCKRKRLADWYVLMLNEIDKKLTEKGINTKICFLVYLDLYWAPETEKIQNPDRFLLMFAPIFRSYSEPFDCSETDEEIEYVCNKVSYPKSTAPYVKFLRDWQNCFNGDSFDFDYHLMWDINRDFSGETIAKVLYSDIRTLKNMGLNGFMSCQIQRAFYPNGFAFYLMGRALFDGSLSYESIRDEYYSAAFGVNSEFASMLYLELQRTVLFTYMREKAEPTVALPYFIEAKRILKKALANFPPKASNPTHNESLALLKFLVENVLRLLNVIVLQIEGSDKQKIEKANKERKDFFNKNEIHFQPYADGFYVNMIVDGIVAQKQLGIYAQ